ncbi:c-type cytochrome [Nisaea denitrificans]|uniref:c-type cytochrome n=1 Tax=Nisaea denitrificans TaxID=390877 RepID=UPI0003FE6A86|nr:cytochrome c [Nisaea denitrificans]
MLRSSAFILIAALAASVSARADEAALEGKGREIALLHCARCHVIDAKTRLGGIGSTPSFPLLMSLADGEHRFITFFDRRPHPVFVRMEGVEPLTPLPANAAEAELSVDDLDALIAYALSLK